MSDRDLERRVEPVLARAAGLVLYARQWLADEGSAAAEDVVQEALAALLVQRRAPDDPVAWMYRAVRNAAIDHARSSTRRRRREQRAAEMRREWFETRSDAAIDGETAEQALRQLPAGHREVVVLRIWGGLGWAQVAQIMQLGMSTVHERYGSALRQLRRAMEKSCENKTTTTD
jgi:RNA polymerase sigma factor (sigma-70 family)